MIRVIVDVGAQYAGAGTGLTVLEAGADDEGPWAFVLAGAFPDVERARLRLGEPYVLRTGATVRLVAVAPPPHAATVALEITEPGGGADA